MQMRLLITSESLFRRQSNKCRFVFYRSRFLGLHDTDFLNLLQFIFVWREYKCRAASKQTVFGSAVAKQGTFPVRARDTTRFIWVGHHNGDQKEGKEVEE
jgi:hypothetical protein